MRSASGSNANCNGLVNGNANSNGNVNVNDGDDNCNVNNNYVDYASVASPVVYLKSDVTITGGDGQSPQTAYTLSYTAS